LLNSGMNSPPSPPFIALRAFKKGGAGFLEVPQNGEPSACGKQEKGVKNLATQIDSSFESATPKEPARSRVYWLFL
jgi:hypothetical protein